MERKEKSERVIPVRFECGLNALLSETKVVCGELFCDLHVEDHLHNGVDVLEER